MKWSKREKYIRRLRRKHGHDSARAAMPDLSVAKGAPSLSATGITRITDKVRAPNKPPPGMIVDTLHKQGMQVLSRDELPWAGGKKP